MELLQMETRLVVARDWCCGEWGNVSQRVQTSSYKMNKF